MRFITCILILLLATNSFSQPASFRDLSKYEKRWAFFHPFAACKLKKHRKEVVAIYNDVKLFGLMDNFENGGKLDAFRHVFTMAYFTRYVKVHKLAKLGKAHEKGNYQLFLQGKTDEAGELPDSLSSVMDLQNNQVGFELGYGLKKISIEELKQKTIDLIKQGGAVIIKRNGRGLYLDCNGNVIDIEKKKGTWNVSKCLVGSGS